MHKRTKIIATIGPSTNEYSSLKDLHAAGMNVARINMSHASQIDALKIIESIQRVNRNQSQSFAFYEERWNPDLAEVKEISNKAYFTIQMGNELPFLLFDNQGFNQGELLSFEIPENNIVKNDFGEMSISIESNTILGDLLIWD